MRRKQRFASRNEHQIFLLYNSAFMTPKMATWYARVSLLAAALVLSALVSGKEVESLQNFKQRECRQRIPRGDVADLLPESLQKIHPRNLKVLLSRQRRFLSFPKGSRLVMSFVLRMPVKTINGNTLSLYIGTPFRLALPSGVLTFRRSNATTTPTPTTTTPPSSGYGAYEANTRFDDHQPGSSYSSYGEGDYYSRNDQDGGSGYFGGYGRRSIDSERRAGFAIIQNGLDNLGLPGRACLLRAVCEIAEEPVDGLGAVGDILNLIFAAGYGEGSEEMQEFAVAEERGRREGDCEGRYSECPLSLAELLQSGLSYLHAGLANTGVQGSGLL
ncbi:uncharacterized protein LOC122257467 [Penaeus japonicus]|uniref:uncharacterized protein LOC122257467 n=1 Tax=Penaeus japonicus TaxID=27405 RepID=UPI001C70E225|nr:uncharacterized protein LOC122257467 [Penaeus japonicus]